MERHGFRGDMAPVNVGEEIDVKIEAVGEKGDGIARKQGFVLFIPNTKEGDEVRVRITKVLKKVGFAEVVGEAQSAPKTQETTKKEEKAEEDLVPEGDDSDNFGEEDVAEETTEEIPEAPEEETEELPPKEPLEEPDE